MVVVVVVMVLVEMVMVMMRCAVELFGGGVGWPFLKFSHCPHTCHIYLNMYTQFEKWLLDKSYHEMPYRRLTQCTKKCKQLFIYLFIQEINISNPPAQHPDVYFYILHVFKSLLK